MLAQSDVNTANNNDTGNDGPYKTATYTAGTRITAAVNEFKGTSKIKVRKGIFCQARFPPISLSIRFYVSLYFQIQMAKRRPSVETTKTNFTT